MVKLKGKPLVLYSLEKVAKVVDEKVALRPLFRLLRRPNVKSILDCSCGLGFKTILFAKKGYQVEGSDGSPNAVRYARQLAKQEGFKIRFFLSRYAELGRKAKRKYDCVFSDNFDEIETIKSMRAAAKAIHSVLNDHGKLIFLVSPPRLHKRDLKRIIEMEWKRKNDSILNHHMKKMA